MKHRLIKGDSLVLYGTVGATPFFFDEEDEEFRGFTDVEVVKALSELKGDINVRINSGGGIATQGSAIYNSLRAYDGNVTIYVDGIAASAASIIAMAGDEVVMREGSMMMIHNASGITMGTARDHNKAIEALSRLDTSMAGIYAKKTGGTTKAARAMMDEETWFTAQEAVDEGLADRTDEEQLAEEAVAFDYRMYANAPDHLVSRAEQLFSIRQPVRKTDKMELNTMNKPLTQEAFDAMRAENTEMFDAVIKAEMEKAADKAAADAAADKAASDAAEALAKAKADAEAAAADKANKQLSEKTGEPTAEEATQRSVEIFAACDLAGKVAKAGEYIASKKTVGEVITELRKDRTSDAATSSVHTPTDPIDPKDKKDDKIVSWEKSVSKLNKTLGV